ncbi:MAG: cytochrome c biogenesis protein ResB [Candidatus Coatesbacteria bacterium]
MKRTLEALGSLKLAVVGMVLLMLLVGACTLAQVRLGIYGAVAVYIRTFLVWVRVPGTALSVPVFPGGGFVGLLLIVNMTASLVTRWSAGRLKPGLALTHIGVILLLAGEFQTAFRAHESSLSIEVGQTLDYTEATRRTELAIEEGKAPAAHGTKAEATPAGKPLATISERDLARGGELALPGLPVSLKVLRFLRNGHLVMQKEAAAGAIVVTAGSGRKLTVVELPAATSDDEPETPVAYVEAVAGGKSLGVWLVSPVLGPQVLEAGGRKLALSMHPERVWMPFTLTLKHFSHDVYPGTDIPRNFSSLVRLVDAERHEDRDVLIWMNHPLRYRGLTFYQASYGKGDTLSVLQVVRNPGWILPYLSCLIVTVGMAWHFLLRLAAARRDP